MATDVTWRGTTDGDWSVATNWSDGAVPAAADNVSIPAGAPSITAGLGQSGVALGIVRVESGFVNTIGLDTDPLVPTYLDLDCDRLELYGAGKGYFNLSPTGTIPVIVGNSIAVGTGLFGWYIKGGTIDADIRGGTVGIATWQEDTATIDDLAISGGAVTVGVNATIADTILRSGTVNYYSEIAQTTFRQMGGTANIHNINAGTVEVFGGKCFMNWWTTTPTLATLHAGTLDFTLGTIPRTLTAMTLDGGACHLDPNIVTVTTLNKPSKAVKIVTTELV